MKQKCFVFRIRKRYFDAIVNGQKPVEYRADSEFWRRRFGIRTALDRKWPMTAVAHAWRNMGPAVAVFICGKRAHRRQIVNIQYERTPSAHFSSQGKKDVPTIHCFAIYLGPEVKEKKPGFHGCQGVDY